MRVQSATPPTAATALPPPLPLSLSSGETGPLWHLVGKEGSPGCPASACVGVHTLPAQWQRLRGERRETQWGRSVTEADVQVNFKKVAQRVLQCPRLQENKGKWPIL